MKRILVSRKNKTDRIAIVEGSNVEFIQLNELSNSQYDGVDVDSLTMDHLENLQGSGFDSSSLEDLFIQIDSRMSRDSENDKDEELLDELLFQLDDDIDEILVDNKKLYQKILAFLREEDPDYCPLVKLYQDKDLFEKYTSFRSADKEQYSENNNLSDNKESIFERKTENKINHTKTNNTSHPTYKSDQGLVQEGSKNKPLKFILIVIVIALLVVLGFVL
ncbi:hypothetical protein QJU96_09925 [Pasteurella skyensis]|uniref:RNA-binding protein AU-1/Ribonuclease E/G domain-containing protein n=1 Tax=Phocoenobacter skyensis TaxID=97481 RepID=A0AAJ6P3K9_9PAST|nr:ribonuclease E/G [Pasteurella skyensis]MDP8171599.1 hypothetical protein [Pasteurella skyensis]MDP8175845.1 hypothetical protein [Pasteurella skyensis]